MDAGSSASSPRAVSSSSIPTSYRASSITRVSSPTRPRRTVPYSSPARRAGIEALHSLDHFGGRERSLGSFLSHCGRSCPHGVGHRAIHRGVVGEPRGKGANERVSCACGVNDFHARGREVFCGFAVRENSAVLSDRGHDGSWPQVQEFGGGGDGPFYPFDPLSEEEGSLMLVEHQGVQLLEQCPRDFEGRRKVYERAGPVLCRNLDGPLDDLGWDLHLGDEHVSLSDRPGSSVYVLHGEEAVRAWGDRDRVLPVRGDGYESRTRG